MGCARLPQCGPEHSAWTALTRRVARGFGMQILSFVVVALAQFLAVPLCLAAWGTEVYGAWLVVLAVAGLLTMADLGVHGHLCNTLRAAWARGEHAVGRRILRAGLGVYSVLVLVLAVALAAALALIDLSAALGLGGLEHATAILLLLCLPTVLLLPRELVLSVYAAHGEFDRQVADALVLGIGQHGVVIAGALTGQAPVTVASGYFVITLALGWGRTLLALRRRYPDVCFAPCRPTLTEVRSLWAKAPFYAAQQGGGVLLIQLPVIMLGRLGSSDAVVAFTTMRTFINVMRQFSSQFATASGLEIARLHAAGEVAVAARAYDASVILSGGVVGLIAAVLTTFGPAFFALWTRGRVSFDPVLAAVFAGGLLLMIPANCAFGLLRLIDRPLPVAVALIIQTVVGSALCLILIPGEGALGAALAVSVAEVVIAGPILVVEVARLLGRNVAMILLRAYGPALVALGLGFVMARPLVRVLL